MLSYAHATGSTAGPGSSSGSGSGSGASSAPSSGSSAMSSTPSSRSLSRGNSRRGINTNPDYNKTNRRLPVHVESMLISLSQHIHSLYCTVTPQILAKTKGWIKLQALVRGHLTRRAYQKRGEVVDRRYKGKVVNYYV